MAAEGAGQGELAQPVAHHVLREEDGHMASAVVHRYGEPYHLRQDGGAARPGADDGLLAGPLHLHYLLQQLGVGVGALLGGPGHGSPYTSYRRRTMYLSVSLRRRVR